MFAGSAAGGFVQGLHGGMDIATQLAALQAGQHMSAARAAVGRTMMDPNGFGGGPQPPMPGVASMPAHPAMGNTSPDPMMGGGGAPALPSGGAPPVPQPAAPMTPPPGNAGPAPAAAAGDSGVVKDAQTTITSIAQAIKAKNPNITPEELFDATSAHIDQMKGLRNDVHDYMQNQVELAKIQTRLQASENRLTGQEYVADKGYQGRTEAASIRGDAQRDVADTQGKARIGAASISGDSRVKAAGIGAGARVQSAGIGADAQRDVAGTRADASAYGSEQGYRGKVDSAVALSGGTARTPAPVRRSASASGGIPASAVKYLKEGQNTKFGNGQTWTLKGGKPTQVK